MSDDAVGIELTSPSGEPLRVSWPLAALEPERAGEPGGWRLEGELDWDEVDALRTLTARLPDGRALVLVAVRPAKAAGHGDEVVASLLVAKGAAAEAADPLLSVQLGPDGLPTRLGVELYAGGDALPLRIAADVTGASREREGELAHVRATLAVRLDGKAATGAYEVLTPA